MKKIYCFIFSALLLVTGCYKEEFIQIEDEMKNLQDAEIAPLNTQVSRISGSLTTLNALGEELKAYIAALEEASGDLQGNIEDVNAAIQEMKSALSDNNSEAKGEVLAKLENTKSFLDAELATIENTVAALKAKYVSLEEQIASLEKTAEEKYATLDWVNGTFATIEQQNAVIAEVEAVKALSSGLNSTTVKLDKELKDYLEAIAKQCLALADSKISEEIQKITAAYKEAIANAVSEVQETYTTAIAEAINQSEKSIMDWVSNALTDYYELSAAQAQIEVFKGLIGTVPSGKTLQGEIDELTKEIGELGKELGDAYKEAITSAIEKSEGKLGEYLENNIIDIRTKELKSLTDKVGSLEGEIENLWEKLGELETRINTLESQKKAIQESLQILTDTENTLEQYIEGIISELEGKDIAGAEQLKALLADLKKAAIEDDESLSAQIEDLEKYIGTIPTSETSITAWVEGSKNTLYKSLELYAKLDYVNGLNEEISGLLDNHSGRLDKISERLGKEIEDSKDIITGWVNEKLQKDYCDGEAAKGKIDVLESTLRSAFQTADATLETNIANLRQEIIDSDDALRSALATAIETAISEFNGYVSSEVTEELDRIKESLTAVGEKFTELEGIIVGMKQDVIDLNGQITSLKGTITGLQTFIKDSGYENMAGIVKAFKDIIDALPTTYASYSKYQEIYNDIYGKDGEEGYKAQIEKLETLKTDLKTAEDAIKGYQELVAGFTLSGENKQNLKSIFDDINEDLTTLKTTVFGTGSTDPKALRNQLNKIVEKKDEIVSKITELNGKLLNQLKSITTIAAIPNFNDGKLHLDYNDNNESYDGTIQFDVRPKGIAQAVAGVSSIKYVYTPVRSSISFTEVQDAKISGNNNEGRITAEVKLPEDDVTDGLSLALFAEDNGYEIVSDFIAVYTEKRSNILYTSPSYFIFEGVGGTKTMDVYYSTEAKEFTLTNNCKNGKESWIESNLEVERHTITDKKGNKLYHRQYSLTATPNNTSDERTGTIDIEIDYGGFLIFGRSTETISVPISQHKRDNQKFVKFNPESGTIQFTWDGNVIGADGEKTENKYKDITVTTSDLLDDWSVTATEQKPWYKVEHLTSGSGQNKTETNQARISSLDKNETGSERTGTIKFQSKTGTSDDVTYTFTQLKREPTTLKSVNPLPVQISYDGLKYAVETDGKLIWHSFEHYESPYFWDDDEYYYLDITIETVDGTTDWSVDTEATSSWLNASKVDGKLRLRDIDPNTGDEDIPGTIVIKNSAGGIGRLPVTQLCRKPTTITTEDPDLLFSYDGKKYSLDNGENWTNITNNNPCSITVETGDGSTDWTVTPESEGNWLSATTNDNINTVTIRANAWYETEQDREGKITFNLPKQEGEPKVWTVRQQKAPEQIFTFGKVTAASYNYVIGEDGLIHIGQAGGSNMYVYVKGNPVDNWTVSLNDNDSWLTRLTKSEASYGSEYKYRIQISAGANNDVEDRKTTIKFTCNGKDYIYDVWQDGRDAQTFEEFNPASGTIHFSWNGYLLDNEGKYTNSTDEDITVTTSDRKTDWNVAPSEGETWYRVAHRTSSNANQARISNVADNTSGSPRTGTIKFTSATGTTEDYTFTQLKREPTKLLTTDPDITFSFDGTQYKVGDGKWTNLSGNSSKYLDITIETEDKSGDWNIEKSDNSDDWFTVSAIPENDSQNHTSIRIYPQANSGDARESKIKFTFGLGEPVEWTIQQEAHQDMTITVDPEYLEFEQDCNKNNKIGYRTQNSGNFTDTGWSSRSVSITVNTENGTYNDWTSELIEGSDWVDNIQTETDRRGNTTINITPKRQKNNGVQQKATISFKYASGNKKGQEITTWSFYKQGRDAQTFTSFSPNDIQGKTYSFAEQSIPITVVTSDGKTDWEVSATGTGISVDKNNNVATLKLSENKTGAEIQGSITFTPWGGGNPTVFNFTQGARPAQTFTSITPSVDGNEFSYSPQSKEITVTTSDGLNDYTVAVSGTGVSYTKAENKVTLSLSENTTGGVINGSITFTSHSGGDVRTMSFTQQKKPDNVTLSLGTIDEFDFVGGYSQKLTVTTNPSGITGWTVEKTDGNNDWVTIEKVDGGVNVTAALNTGAERSTGLLFKSPSGEEYPVTVSQEAVGKIELKFNGDGFTKEYEKNKGLSGKVEITLSNSHFTDWNIQKTVNSDGNNNNEWLTSCDLDKEKMEVSFSAGSYEGDLIPTDSYRSAKIEFTFDDKYKDIVETNTYTIKQACLAVGTKIMMADGSLKNIEDVVEGDLVMTFDHITGKISSAEVCIAWKGEGTATPLNLTFASGKTLSIVGTHDLLSENIRKYVRINVDNVASFVGQRFYNAESGTWDELVSYEMGAEPVEYYCLYSDEHLNCIAEGMLTLPDDVDFFVNVYELDDNLKADAEQLAADIEQYGLMDVAVEFPDYVECKDLAESILGQYLYISLGKGLISEDDFGQYIDFWDQMKQK